MFASLGRPFAKFPTRTTAVNLPVSAKFDLVKIAFASREGSEDTHDFFLFLY